MKQTAHFSFRRLQYDRLRSFRSSRPKFSDASLPERFSGCYSQERSTPPSFLHFRHAGMVQESCLREELVPIDTRGSAASTFVHSHARTHAHTRPNEAPLPLARLMAGAECLLLLRNRRRLRDRSDAPFTTLHPRGQSTFHLRRRALPPASTTHVATARPRPAGTARRHPAPHIRVSAGMHYAAAAAR